MTLAQSLWLRGQAAQRNMLQLAGYSTAFAGTAALQTLHLGLTAPRSFWAAMARATAIPAPAAEPAPADPARIVSLFPVVLPEPATAGGRAPDDLTALTGVGPKLARALNAAGIDRFAQVAALDPAQIADIEARQKGFRMICARHDLVGQARARLMSVAGGAGDCPGPA